MVLTSKASLTPSQQEAVFHKNGPLLVLAGPGSGKTRVITHRIAALIDSGVAGWHICAITFTNKAADEMRQRVLALAPSGGVYVSTFHSLCVRILRQFASFAKLTADFSIYDVDDQKKVIKQAIADCNADVSAFQPARMLETISRLKNDLEDETAYAARASDRFSQTAAKIYAQYQKILRANNAVDFDDLLVKTAFLLRDWPEIRMQLSERFRYLLVDEYQDTNHAQYQIAKGLALAHRNICVTGDPDQSIYRWRGADIRNILVFEKDWPDAKVVRLEENFRSTPNILQKASALIVFNTQRKHKDLIAVHPAGEDVAIEPREDEADEAAFVAESIRNRLKAGADPNQIAVFYRVNAMSRPIEESLIRLRLPYQVVRGIEFYARKEVKDLLAYLKLMVNPQDDAAFERAVQSHPRGIGKTSLERLAEFARQKGISLFAAAQEAKQVYDINKPTQERLRAFAAMIEKLKKDAGGAVAPLMDCVFSESGYLDYLKSSGAEGADAIENINELINAAAEYDRQAEQPSLGEYMQSIALYSDADAFNPNAGKVALMTLHAAKGLEFDHVYIIGLEEGVLPHQRSIDGAPEDIEEERRLLFVGITRAKKTLTLTFARHRVLRGQFIRSMPSPFLYEMGYKGEQSEEFGDNFDDKWNDWQDDFSKPARKKTVAPTAQGAGIRVGQRVKHSKFGAGRVLEYLDLGDDSVAVVKFDSGQTKSLLMKYAKLEIVNR